MTGEKDLTTLLSSMNPELLPEEYVFCTMSPEARKELKIEILMEFREREGITLVVAKNDAINSKLKFSFPARMITLNVHSNLEAVGFLAAITQELASNGISVNAVSAFYHDHLFVPTDKAERAMEILLELSKR